MATNNLTSNTSDLVIRKFLDQFTCSQVLSKTVDTQLIEDEINPRTGSRVRIKRPHQYRSKRTPDGDISALTTNDIIAGSAFAEVQDYITVDLDWGQLEQAIQLDQLDEIIKPAAMQMVCELEVSLAQYMNQNAALSLGDAGTPITAWGEVAGTKSLMESLGVPMGEEYAVMNPFYIQNLADTQSGLASGDNSLVNEAWRNAMISRNFGGLQGLTSNALSAHTNGTYDFAGVTVAAPPTQTYVSAKDTYTMSLALTGGTLNGTITAGTVIQITAASGSLNWVNLKTRQTVFGADGNPVLWTGVVTEDVTADGAGDVTVTVTAALFETDGQYNNVSQLIAAGDAVASVSGAASATVMPSLFYHKQAFGLGTVKLPKLYSKESKVVTEGGFSIRMTMDSDTKQNTQFVRFDLLPTFATFNPLFAGRFYGTAP